MFYAILGMIVVVALFLIFRDDHDDSYNKSEKGQRKAQPKKEQTHYQKEAGPKTGSSGITSGTKAEKKASGPTLKDQILGEIEQAISEAQKGWNTTGNQTDVDEQFPEEGEELDLSILDNIDYSDDLEENTETFDITGLRYHCTVHDCGKIVGIVKPEPSNVHDPRAQAVYRNDGKLLGYIPRTQLDWYEDFNEENVPCPFVGEIELDRSSARLIAEIKVIIPSSREFVEEEIKDEL